MCVSECKSYPPCSFSRVAFAPFFSHFSLCVCEVLLMYFHVCLFKMCFSFFCLISSSVYFEHGWNLNWLGFILKKKKISTHHFRCSVRWDSYWVLHVLKEPQRRTFIYNLLTKMQENYLDHSVFSGSIWSFLQSQNGILLSYQGLTRSSLENLLWVMSEKIHTRTFFPSDTPLQAFCSFYGKSLYEPHSSLPPGSTLYSLEKSKQPLFKY